MKPNIEISAPHLDELANVLNKLLANEYVLYTKTRGAHWNVEGPTFIALHEFFQKQYEALDIVIDDVAERIRALGHFPNATLKDFVKLADLLEDSGQFGSPRQMIQALTNDHETIIRIIRNEIATISDKYKDFGTADFVTGLMEQHEKMSWMLRAHISQSKE